MDIERKNLVEEDVSNHCSDVVTVMIEKSCNVIDLIFGEGKHKDSSILLGNVLNAMMMERCSYYLNESLDNIKQSVEDVCESMDNIDFGEGELSNTIEVCIEKISSDIQELIRSVDSIKE